MKSAIIKTVSLVFLCSVSGSPVIATEILETPSTTKSLKSISNPASTPSKLAHVSQTPDSVRESWVKTHKNNKDAEGKYDFALLSPTSKGKTIGIAALRAAGENAEFVNFIPTDVPDNYAATDFLNKTLPYFEKDTEIRPNMIGAMDNFLTIKSANLRAAAALERAINLRATYEIAKTAYDKNNQGKYDFNYWMNYFSSTHGDLANNETVRQTLTTRATAAALSVLAVSAKNAIFKQQAIGKIQTASDMKMEMLENFIKEINTATADKLQSVVDALSAKGPNIAGLMSPGGFGTPSKPRTRKTEENNQETQTGPSLEAPIDVSSGTAGPSTPNSNEPLVTASPSRRATFKKGRHRPTTTLTAFTLPDNLADLVTTTTPERNKSPEQETAVTVEQPTPPLLPKQQTEKQDQQAVVVIPEGESASEQAKSKEEAPQALPEQPLAPTQQPEAADADPENKAQHAKAPVLKPSDEQHQTAGLDPLSETTVEAQQVKTGEQALDEQPDSPSGSSISSGIGSGARTPDLQVQEYATASTQEENEKKLGMRKSSETPSETAKNLGFSLMKTELSELDPSKEDGLKLAQFSELPVPEKGLNHDGAGVVNDGAQQDSKARTSQTNSDASRDAQPTLLETPKSPEDANAQVIAVNAQATAAAQPPGNAVASETPQKKRWSLWR